jgi:cobalt/nickel transport protein
MNGKKVSTFLIVIAIIALAVIPLVVAKDAEFAGADGLAEELILTIRPDYQPWFSSLIEPKSGEIESLLFALQAAIGSGIVFYGVGYYSARAKGKKEEGK